MDNFIINFLNALAHKANFITKVLFLIVNNNLLKGGVILAILWYLWFNQKSKESQSREKIILTLLGALVAILAGRLLNNLLPYRPRPILNPDFEFTYQIDNYSWLNVLSSFPSDHAILFFALATGIYFISKKWGLFSYAYVLIIICFPRVYLGFHYPTDILAGAAIGVIIMWAVTSLQIIKDFSKKIIRVSIKFPGIFYALFFLMSYQIATLFNNCRELMISVFNYLYK